MNNNVLTSVGVPLSTMHTSGLFADMSVDGPEIGTLVAVVDRAKNLPNLKTMGKQNPYCAARLGKEVSAIPTIWLSTSSDHCSRQRRQIQICEVGRRQSGKLAWIICLSTAVLCAYACQGPRIAIRRTRRPGLP